MPSGIVPFAQEPPGIAPDKAGRPMARLTIHLQDGFANDSVVVRVNGNEVYRRSGVTTQLVLGRAEVFATEVPEGPVDVEVEVPTRHVQSTFRIEALPKTHLALSLTADGVDHFVSTKAFAYA
jgi:hypothetical protein